MIDDGLYIPLKRLWSLLTKALVQVTNLKYYLQPASFVPNLQLASRHHQECLRIPAHFHTKESEKETTKSKQKPHKDWELSDHLTESCLCCLLDDCFWTWRRRASVEGEKDRNLDIILQAAALAARQWVEPASQPAKLSLLSPRHHQVISAGLRENFYCTCSQKPW